ncbi:O-antigen polysaccharide polymerase Wzy [Proteiniphilum saccharofermentans]|uniref:O-antigen polysaccharide polymerase Wzy n=1 Tax=Proteiniphilum saccharofermentans TaxID=1642647 RepID=UPI0028A5951C|nr:O-antigen polysaccharide polymerase Wzy [Proteiniphilum saccharofermentans]
MLQKVLYPLLILLLLSSYIYLPNTMDKGVMILLLSIVALVLVLFFIHKEGLFVLRKNYFRNSILFIIGYVIVHFQYPLDYVLGNVSADNFFIWINRTIVVKSMFFSTIGLVSFLWGYTLYSTSKKSELKHVVVKERVLTTKTLLWLATAFLALYFYTVNPLYLSGYYGSVGMGATATYVVLLFKVFIFAVLIQNVRNMRIKQYVPSSFLDYVRQQGYFLLVLIAIYLLSVMFSGDRGPIISFSIAYVAGYYFVSKKKLSFSRAGILLMAAALFITILGITRSLDKDMSFVDRVKESVTHSKFEEPSILPQTSELAGSVRTLHAVVDYVPKNHPHTYGRFQLQLLTSSIPFSSGLLSFLPESGHIRFKGPASFATWLIQGENPNSGVGTTCIADLYVEFGLFGVLFGMLLFGFFIRYAEVNFYKIGLPALFPHILSFVYLSDAIYISRSSILFGFRTALWIYIVLIINRYLLNRR